MTTLPALVCAARCLLRVAAAAAAAWVLLLGQARAQSAAALDEAALVLARELAARPMAAGLRLAVLPLDQSSGSNALPAALAAYLQRQLTAALVNGAGVELVERQMVHTTTDEMRLQRSGAFDAATVAALGKLSGATAVLAGTVTPFDDSIGVQATVVEVATGRVLAVASTQVRREFRRSLPAAQSQSGSPDSSDSASPATRSTFRPFTVRYTHHQVQLIGIQRVSSSRAIVNLAAGSVSGLQFTLNEAERFCTARLVFEDGTIVACARGSLPPVGAPGLLLQGNQPSHLQYVFEGHLPAGRQVSLELSHSLLPVMFNHRPAPLRADTRMPTLGTF